MAIITAINMLFESFTQLGINEAIIQNSKGNDKVFLNSAFFINFSRGIFLFTVAYIAAPWIAQFYEKPQAIPIMRFAFLYIVFASSISVNSFAEQKKIKFKKWAYIFHGGNAVGVCSSIILSFIIPGVWALVIGYVVESFSRLVLSYLICPFIPGFKFERESFDTLFKFSKGIFGMPILFFLFCRVDIFVLGKLCSNTELGIYSMARGLANIPAMIFTGAIGKLLLPVFSLSQDNIHSLRDKYFKVLTFNASIFLPVLVIMTLLAKPILLLAYGKIYAMAGTVLIISCAVETLSIFSQISTNISYSLGKPSISRNASIIRLIIAITLIIPLIKLWGTNGAALTIFLSLMVFYSIVIIKIKKILAFKYSSLFLSFVPGIVISVAIIALYFTIQFIIRFV
jgi:PST family polysaccharide transporter/lipopolysaccharide exporter